MPEKKERSLDEEKGVARERTKEVEEDMRQESSKGEVLDRCLMSP